MIAVAKAGTDSARRRFDVETRLATLLLSAALACASAQGAPSVRVVALTAADGTELKASYYAASEPGPGVLLFHQSNRMRDSWDSVARQLAAAGIHALAIDKRGHGDSGGNYEREPRRKWWPGDLDAAFDYLASRPGVRHDSIGAVGAGALGVADAVETARRHAAAVKSLVLLSGETLRPQLQFLHEVAWLPALFVVSDDDEYPPTQKAMLLLYASAGSPAKKLIHYVSEREAPWLWYEPFDIGKVPAGGGHGTDLFAGHSELPGIVVHWLATTLIETPGHAAADPVAAGPVLAEVEFGRGAAHARELLMEARQRDPAAELWPEISMSIVAQDFQREGDVKAALEVFELNLFAYPDSADANESLAEAYLAEGRSDLARQYAEKSLALLVRGPASSWSNTDEYRDEVRKAAQKVLVDVKAANASRSRDCAECPELVVIPAGRFIMGSSQQAKQWAAAHGGNLASVADESPQHEVAVKSFALGVYLVTRGEYAAFVRETGHSAGDGCGRDSFKWNKQPELNWQHPGFEQSDRDPVVCVSWQDAQAYIGWLNGKVRAQGAASGPYRLPSEAEWEYAARAGSSTHFWWGDAASEASAHAWYKANSDGRTHAVGSKPANAFGVYDAVGNVWQWTQDCYAESYAGAAADGAANESPSACMRVDRGGSWLYPAWLLRSATRERNPADYRDVIMGFRVARNL